MKKRWIALISIALLCLLCGAASADKVLSDDGCWVTEYNPQSREATITGFFIDAQNAGQYCSDGQLTIPARIRLQEIDYNVTSLKGLGKDNTNFSKVILPEGLQTIGDAAFRSFSRLREVTLPSTLTAIGREAFRDCIVLKNLDIPGSVTSIGDIAFRGTSGLTITFGGTRAEWDSADNNTTSALCGAITSRVITTDGYELGWCGDEEIGPDRTTWVMKDGSLTINGAGHIISPGWSAANIRTLTIGPEYTELTNIGADDYVFLEQMAGLTTIQVDSGNQYLYAYDGILYKKDTCLYCPCGRTGTVEITGDAVTIESIRDAFDSRTGITGFTVAEGNTALFAAGGFLYDAGGKLLYCASGVSGTVTIPAVTASIDEYAFRNRAGINSFSVENNNPVFSSVNGLLLNKDGSTLVLCPPGMTTVNIPQSVHAFDSGVFRMILGSFTVNLPDSLRIIPSSSFSNCRNLTKVSIPAGVRDIENGAFRNCSGLTSVTLPNEITYIRDEAFAGCTGLTSLILPDSLLHIGEGAFGFCEGLTEITIPGSVRNIGAAVFENCTGLRNVTFQHGFSVIQGNMFTDCTGLTSVTIPDSVTSIKDLAFSGCSSLTVIGLPASITTISKSAFRRSGLKDLYYAGTGTQWASVSLGTDALPFECNVHTQDDQSACVSVNLTGMSDSDSVTLTDGFGTLKAINSSGNQTFWEKDPKITVTPGEGRRVTYNLSYTHTEDGVTSTRVVSDGTNNSTVVVPLDLSRGTPELSLIFEVDGYKAYHLFVNEKELDGIFGDWALTLKNSETSYSNGDVVLVEDGVIAQRKDFTLSLELPIPTEISSGNPGYVGELIYGSERIIITDAKTTYDFTASQTDIILNLTWFNKNNWHTVTYDGNGSSGSTPTQMVSTASLVFVTVAENSFDGKHGSKWLIFNGWNDSSGKGYKPGDSISILSEDITLYAQWIDAWRLEFDANGGVGSMDARLFPQTDAEVTVPPCEFTYTGKAFKEWNTNKNGNGTDYQPGATFTLNTNTKLYVIWEDGWTVSGEAEPAVGGTVTGTGTYLKNTPVTLTATPAEHYRFACWTDENDRVVSMEAEYTFMPTEDRQLTARFEQSEYKITAQYCTVTSDGGYTPVAFAAPGTELFIGWDFENQPEGMYWTEYFSVNGEALAKGEYEFTMPEENVTVAAVYLPQETITIDLSAGTASVPGTALYTCGKMDRDEQKGFYLMDLNNDDAYDLKLTPWEEGNDMLVSPLNGMTVLSPSVTKDISAEHGQYGTVIFRFGVPTFDDPAAAGTTLVLPANLNTIEAGAFDGDIAMTSMNAGHCTSIGPEAFKGCTGLMKIRLSKDCAIDDTAFDGCTKLFAIYGPAGGDTQSWADAHHILFIGE